jgi:two-component system phosphate regulon sensor histidine kinase PhoR/two-component system sensor histidine kinase VicK
MNETNAEIAELKKEIATKSDLISISAHQLRTSLTSMKWILKMFIDGDFGELTAEQKNFIGKVYESDERLIRLVNEMLSINHAEDMLETISPTPTDLVLLMDEVIFDFSSESYKRGIELMFLKPSTQIAFAMTDSEKIRVVFQNLIENAIKYSNKGDRVVVTASEKDNMIEISVRDTGIGISLEEQDRIFGKFFRADNAKKQDVVGSGLGLYTTKRIVEKHGGTIRFESIQNEGTTFFVTLPKA